MFDRVIIIVIDGCGVGEMPDASEYGDDGSATLPHTAEAVGGLEMPACQSFGLGNITDIIGVDKSDNLIGSYGKMASLSKGKDSTTGHWEIAGLITEKALPLFPNGFPNEIIKLFEDKVGIKTIGNCSASGTEIIDRLGPQHLESGELILYTSADSVFQLAAHEDIYPVEKQYEICRAARELLIGEFAVARVIARPFVGKPGSFKRTAQRKDFSLVPPHDTILNLMQKKGHLTLAVGKINDLFAGYGLSNKIKTASNEGVMVALQTAVENDKKHSLIFSNLVDFDMLWGHRRDFNGFALGLEKFDKELAGLLKKLRENDLLIITADHGCDPTFEKHTDHTREYVPLLVYGNKAKAGINLGTRNSFSDVAATIKEIFNLNEDIQGSSFLGEIYNG